MPTPCLNVMTILEAATTTDACPLRKAPFEVMEMIFGQLNLPDLPVVVRVSKWIKVWRQSIRAFYDL